jgi:hypothetical protein
MISIKTFTFTYIECASTLPDALSPQTLQATKLFVLDDELEFESAADVVVPVAVDVGENG